jgi:protein-disulfide isomerase
MTDTPDFLARLRAHAVALSQTLAEALKKPMAKGALLVATLVVFAAGMTVGQLAQPTSQAATAGGSPGAFSGPQKAEIEGIVREFLLGNPEVLVDVQNALEAKMDKVQAERMVVAMKDNAGDLYRSAASPVVNAGGDVPVVEFFDYNCGYCKKAFPDVAQLVESDKKVRLILKEFPILAKGSEEASKVALAAKKQGKYWEFHRAMIENQGQANEASALRVAEQLGLDMARLKKDMAAPEVKKEIDDTHALANKMGIQGTPHFIVGDKIIPGAPENLLELLNKRAAEVRKEGCKLC